MELNGNVELYDIYYIMQFEAFPSYAYNLNMYFRNFSSKFALKKGYFFIDIYIYILGCRLRM